MKRIRKQKLIKPALQLRIIVVFLCAAVIAMLFQTWMINSTIQSLASRLPHDEHVLLSEWPEILQRNLTYSALVLVPLMVGLGVPITFRLAGPLHRLERYIQNVLGGAETGPCKLRRHDEMQELCRLVNDVSAGVRAKNAIEGPRSSGDGRTAA